MEWVIDHLVTMSLTSILWGQDEMASNLQTVFSYIFFNENDCILIRKFVPKAQIDNKLAFVQTTSQYLNKWWLGSLTHGCLTCWVNIRYNFQWNTPMRLFCYVLCWHHPFLWIKVMHLPIFVRLLHWHKGTRSNVPVLTLYRVSRQMYTKSCTLSTLVAMMTSSNGNIFSVTGRLCGEFTGHRWILRTKASGARLGCLLWSAPE